jgi:hypothetical protein
MAVEQEHFVHLARPLAPTAMGFAAGSAPLTVNIQPQVCRPLFTSCYHHNIPRKT